MLKLLIFSFKKSRLLSKIAAEPCIKSVTQENTLLKRDLHFEQLLAL